MIPGLAIDVGGAPLARRLFEPICQLYAEVFSEPPFHWEPNEAEQHRTRLTNLIASSTCGLVVATVDGELGAFAYGYRLPETTRWWDGFLEPVPTDLVREYDGRTFAVIDIGVRRDLRRKGLGSKLLRLLLESRTEERATLAVQPETADAHAFYRRLGWHYVGRLRGVPGESAPYFDIYWLPLREAAAD